MALVGHWTLQDNAANTTISATVGSSGVLAGAGLTSASSGTPGPGTVYSRYLSFAPNARADLTTGNTSGVQNKAFITLAIWFKVTTAQTTGNHRLVFSSTAGGSTRCSLGINTSGQILAVARAGDGESAQTKTSTSSYDDNVWHHAAAIYDFANDAITIYIDGSSVSSTGTISFTGTATDNTTTTAILIGGAIGSEYFTGLLADGRIYDSNESANIGTIRAAAGLGATIEPLSGCIPGSDKDPINSGPIQYWF
jgi:hypothetical protein